MVMVVMMIGGDDGDSADDGGDDGGDNGDDEWCGAILVMMLEL